IPIAGLRGVDPGVIEELLIRKRNVLRITHVHAGQPLDALGEVLVGIRPVLGPPAERSSPARDAAESAARVIGILDAQEMKFGVGRKLGFRSFGAESAEPSEPS